MSIDDDDPRMQDVIEDLREQNARLQRELAALRQQLAATRGVLELVEWSGYCWRKHTVGDGMYLVAACPVCYRPQDAGHMPGCSLVKAKGDSNG